MKYKIRHNMNYCIGCKCCQLACKDKHNLPVGLNLICIQEQELLHVSGLVKYSIKMCLQCKEPKCLLACPEKAIVKDENDIILIDRQLCTGCKKCLDHCTVGAIMYYSDFNVAIKCDGCIQDRIRKEVPACVQACPMNCLTYALKGE